MTVIITAPSVNRLEAEEADLIHWVSCEDPNRTVCGLDATNMEWSDPADDADCVVCTSLYREEN